MIEFRTLNKEDEQFVDEMLKTLQDNDELVEALNVARANSDTDKIFHIWQECYARRLLKKYGTHKLYASTRLPVNKTSLKKERSWQTASQCRQ